MIRIPSIFETQNAKLAAAIIFAGIVPHDIQRRYTLEEEKRYGGRARDLAKRNLGGRIGFQFERGPELEAIVAAYDEQQRKENEGDNTLSLREEDEDWTITP